MLYDIHINTLIPKESYELRIGRFTYPLTHQQLVELSKQLESLKEVAERLPPTNPAD